MMFSSVTWILFSQGAALYVNRIELSGCSLDKACAIKDDELITTQLWAEKHYSPQSSQQ